MNLRLGGVFLMLAGFALENLAKALYVLTRRPKVDGELPRDLCGHDIKKVLSRAGVTLTPHEEALAAKLSEAAIWSGRYSAPTKAKDMKAIRLTTLLDDPERFRALFARVEKEFKRRDGQLLPGKRKTQ
jgi:hypothetical protein